MSTDLQTVQLNNVGKNQRNSGLDLLRCVAMLMVVVLHFLGKGSLLPDLSQAGAWTGVGIVAWFFEAVCIAAVNIYMLISGYFLCESSFKLSRLITLYIQLWFYSVLVGASAYFLGFVPAEKMTTYNKLTLLLPVSMGHYWFLTAYIYFYLLLPVLIIAVKSMSKKQLGITVVLLLVAHSVLKSVLPVVLEMDGKGYDFIWYTVLFLLAAYIRRYEPGFIKRGVSVVLLILGVLGSFAEVLLIGKVCQLTGALSLITTISMHYNHIFVLLSALGFLGLFRNIKISPSIGKVLGKIGSYTLGVYLLHENLFLRYEWPTWFGSEKITTVSRLLICVLLAAVVMFAAGTIVDFVRDLLFKGLHKLLSFVPPYKKLCRVILKVDSYFAGGEKVQKES